MQLLHNIGKEGVVRGYTPQNGHQPKSTGDNPVNRPTPPGKE